MLSRQLKLILFITVFLISGALLFNAITRDIVYEKDYTSDLRNRVVGARLIKDGKSPYFYKWKEADGVRYYDPDAFGYAVVSNITATPFFHELLIPISGLSQKAISKIWLWIEYIMLLTIALVAISFCNSIVEKLAVLTATLAFLYTEAWKSHVFTGQMYLTIAFFSSLFIFILAKSKNAIDYLLCGIVSTTLVFIRPNFIVFFLPFILLLPNIKLKSIIALLLPGIVAIIITLSNAFQKQLWTNFFDAVKIHTAIHQGEAPEKKILSYDPKYTEWEGLNMKYTSTLKQDMAIYPKSENGNFFVLARLVFHKQINSLSLMLISFVIILFLLISFFFKYRKINIGNTDLRILFCLGFCIYMVTDLFSPIYRNQYYTIQWVAPVLLFFSVSKFKADLKFILLISSGIILNMINTPLIKMEHTIGEYLVLCTLLLYSFVYFKRKKVES